jgi:nucleoid DNA-binding protein
MSIVQKSDLIEMFAEKEKITVKEAEFFIENILAYYNSVQAIDDIFIPYMGRLKKLKRIKSLKR